MNRDIRIYLVWPRTEPVEPHIGFGAHRWLLTAMFLACLVPAAALTTLLLLDTARTTMIIVSAVGLLAEMLLLAANLRYYRFYEIDSAAKPLRKLGVQPPQMVSGRRPITRRRFLTLQEN